MKQIGTIIAVCGLTILCTACGVLQAVALKDCQYSYHEVKNITFMDKPANELLSVSGIALVTKALLGKTETVPLGFTVHIDVENPNKTTAGLERLAYIVSLDDFQIASGNTEQSLIVVGQGKADLPLRLVVDLKTALQGEQRQVLTKTLKNFLGMTADPVEVTVQLRPIVRFGTGVINSPKYIPIHFTYSGKNAQ